MTQFTGQKLLLAPLDWGLGHATRCIPIIRALQEQDCTVFLAGEGAQEILLRKEFPRLAFLPLPGYRVRYSARYMMGKLLWQVPKILNAVKMENLWLNQKIKEHEFNIIIADNRYGLHHKQAYCIFITHQLYIKSPAGKWTEEMLQYFNYKYINQFNECWVPDEPGENNLAGLLSHPDKLPSTTLKYIGPLSRFEKSNFTEIKDHLLVILSGPEPQRTILEDKIIDEIAHYNGSATVVRGLPAELNVIPSTNSIQFYNHLSTESLQHEIEKASWIISRCGYSTVMDMAVMQKKSILIPTPGQPEQEYLANHLMEKKFALCMNQKEFSIRKSLEEARQFNYKIFGE